MQANATTSFKKITILILLFGLLGSSCSSPSSNSTLVSDFPSEPITLKIWRPFDEASAFAAAAESYRNLHPNVTFEYKYIEPDTYESVVLNALASGNGPDIISINHDQVPAYFDKLVPMPEKFFGGSDITASLTARYAPAVADDVIYEGKAYAVPFSTDSLALYWNSDLASKLFNEYINSGREFNQQLLLRPPADWQEVIEATKLITSRNGNTIIRSGIALGTSNNVPFASDIIAAMMLQRGIDMTSPDHRNANYHVADSSNPTIYPGALVLEYLSGFVNPASAYYSWNKDMPNGLDAFIEGQAAMIIADRSVARLIEQRNPTLRFRISPLPQLPNAEEIVDYARYPVEAVTNNSEYSEVAWDFLQHVSTYTLALYFTNTDRTNPIRNQAATTTVLQRTNITSGTFSLQVGTARSWYKGPQALMADSILADALDRVSIDGQSARDSLNQAAALFTATLQ